MIICGYLLNYVNKKIEVKFKMQNSSYDTRIISIKNR